MTKELDLRIHLTVRYAGVFRSVPNHNSSISAHGSNNIGVLGLVSSFVHFSLMVDLLHNVEFDLHDRRLLSRTTSEAANLFTILIVVCGVRSYWFRELYVGNLKIVLGLAGGMGTDEEAMSCVVFVGHTMLVNDAQIVMGLENPRLLVGQPLR